MLTHEEVAELADHIREVGKYGDPMGAVQSTCDFCGAALVVEDCPNFGDGPEHARPVITAVVLEINGERVTFERRPF